MIAGIHNKNHKLTNWSFEEDFEAETPVLTYPFQHKLEGFYCGPPPYISDKLIKENLSKLSTHEFCLWLFSEGKRSKVTDGIFPSWHKNDWNLEKFIDYGNSVGFSEINKSEYSELNFNILNKKNREASDKKPLSLYINFIK